MSIGLAYITSMKSRGRPAKKDRSEVGRRIAQAREVLGITQAELAARLQLSQQTVAFWERDASAPRAEYLPQLAKILNVTTDYLLVGEFPVLEKKQKPGPPNKLELCFAEVTKLMPKQQERIIDVVNALVVQARSLS